MSVVRTHRMFYVIHVGVHTLSKDSQKAEDDRRFAKATSYVP